MSEDTRRALSKPGAASATEVELGRTERTRAGYWVRLGRVEFEGEGLRVRISLNRGDTFVRHLDLTQELAHGLCGLLKKL